ncbi:recombinase family protein [Clostridium prolinivorans]|uniref:recombinase family protein n=1 Tax=Clostridium prolinivorans TaxID=2769420 RepID=UPI000FD771BA|nr:recombinase family protein [Clostridium prolinivorans]
MKKITTIAVKNKGAIDDKKLEKTRVCAYCRVSTDSLKQAESFEMQTIFYEDYIKKKIEWEFAGIYADQGTTGTKTDKRLQFKKMIKDCELGKIDLIITKSISRFARNTADCLEAVRYLRSLNVGVYFERENINTLGADSELILSILSSIAQDEARSMSENIRWSFQKKFKEGKIQINTKRFLGYDLSEDGKLIVNPEEAKIVKRIFREYLDGKSLNGIKDGLEKDKIKTATGAYTWHGSAIKGILSNEKYYGDLILQKTYTVDFLNNKKRKNKGEVPQYIVEGHHEAIVSKEDFLKVQAMMSERAAQFGNVPEIRHKYNQRYAFSGKLICGNCGATLKRRLWNSKAKSKQVVWLCKTYINEGKSSCNMKALDDITLKAVFVRVFNRLEYKEDFAKAFTDNIEKVLKQGAKCEDAFKLDRDISNINEEIKSLVRQQIKGELREDEFDKKYIVLKKMLEDLQVRKEALNIDSNKYDEILKRTAEIKRIINLRETALVEFDDDIFEGLIEKVVVITPTYLEFHLKNGMKVEEEFIKKRGINGLQ